MSHTYYTAEQRATIDADSQLSFIALVGRHHLSGTFHSVFTHEAYLAGAQMTGYWSWVEARLAEAALMGASVSQQ